MFQKSEIEKVILSIVPLAHGSDDSFFKEIYWFGSSVKFLSNPNDIDLLFIYDVWSKALVNTVDEICKQVEDKLHLPIDATVLSEQELLETKFLERLGTNIIKLT